MHVYFATARWRRPRRRVSLRRKLRILRRKPGRFYWWSLGMWVRLLTCSELAHVAIGDGEVVLDPGIRGERAWSQIVFERFFPTLDSRISVPISGQFDLADYEMDPRPKPAWPTWRRWLTRGRTPSRDCVAVVSDLLRQTGIDVPPRLTTPIELFLHLMDHPHARAVFFEPVAGTATWYGESIDREDGP